LENKAVSPAGRVVGVTVEVPALGDRVFDYSIPQRLADRVRVGTMVRVPLHGRRVGGWVVREGGSAERGVRTFPIAAVSRRGVLAADVVELCEWAAWRWSGRRSAFLRSASRAAGFALPTGRSPDEETMQLAQEALAGWRAVLRWPPAEDPESLLGAIALGGAALVVTPKARTAAWAPCERMRSVVVLDAHDDALAEQRAPTWNAWVVAAERARRLGVPCILVTPCPSAEQLAWGRLLRVSAQRERRGWGVLEVIDRRGADPRGGLFGEPFVPLLRGTSRVAVVVNRTGRARLLACALCGAIARCERCGGAMAQPAQALRCQRCSDQRPPVCQACGATRLRVLRAGVTRVAEDVAALARRDVSVVTAATRGLPAGGLLVGTSAVLERAGRCRLDAVLFPDFDAELMAPRARAGESALGLLALAARAVGGHSGRVVVQTRLPEHAVLRAVALSNPGVVVAEEQAVREELRLPPYAALAEVSGEGAAEFVGCLSGLEVRGPDRGRFLVRAPDHQVLCDALAAAPRPPGALRVAVDPLL